MDGELAEAGPRDVALRRVLPAPLDDQVPELLDLLGGQQDAGEVPGAFLEGEVRPDERLDRLAELLPRLGVFDHHPGDRGEHRQVQEVPDGVFAGGVGVGCRRLLDLPLQRRDLSLSSREHLPDGIRGMRHGLDVVVGEAQDLDLKGVDGEPALREFFLGRRLLPRQKRAGDAGQKNRRETEHPERNPKSGLVPHRFQRSPPVTDCDRMIVQRCPLDSEREGARARRAP